MEPMPKINPVINRLVLFDKRLNNNCRPPSKGKGTRRSKHIKGAIIHLRNKSKIEHKYPIRMPEQRAHRGI